MGIQASAQGAGWFGTYQRKVTNVDASNADLKGKSKGDILNSFWRTDGEGWQ